MDLSFEGFGPEALAVLDRLRQHPHIDQYRAEKPHIDRHLMQPFKRFRDDLVVHWVIPEQLPLETERNVFSRLLKNDFGAGGCHHHLWLSFYRPGYRRITDLQLAHSLYPDRFTVTLFAARHMQAVYRTAVQRIQAAPGDFMTMVNALAPHGAWQLHLARGSGRQRQRTAFDLPLEAVPPALDRADSFWLRRSFPAEQVLAWQERLVVEDLQVLRALWPIYQFLLDTPLPAGLPGGVHVPRL